LSEIAASKVDVIINALSGLEDDVDSLNTKIADMKKKLNTKTQNEIDKIMEQTTKMATQEAESLISQSREKSKIQADQILKKGEENLAKIKAQIDSKFDQAVDHVASIVLKA